MSCAAHSECPVAQKFLQDLYDDPMSAECGCLGEIIQGWLQTHIKTCTMCREATIEANMP